MNNHSLMHYQATNKDFRYLKGTKNHMLLIGTTIGWILYVIVMPTTKVVWTTKSPPLVICLLWEEELYHGKCQKAVTMSSTIEA